MSNYRRMMIPGGTYFFTVNLRDRSSDLLIGHIDLLRASYSAVSRLYPFETVAIVILPDHLHCIWRLPPGDTDYSTRMRLLKQGLTKKLSQATKTNARPARGEAGVWQRRFWEHLIRDEKDLENHINYIHSNPVKHGHVTDLNDWPYSSWHRFKVASGGSVVRSMPDGGSPFG